MARLARVSDANVVKRLEEVRLNAKAKAAAEAKAAAGAKAAWKSVMHRIYSILALSPLINRVTELGMKFRQECIKVVDSFS